MQTPKHDLSQKLRNAILTNSASRQKTNLVTEGTGMKLQANNFVQQSNHQSHQSQEQINVRNQIDCQPGQAQSLNQRRPLRSPQDQERKQVNNITANFEHANKSLQGQYLTATGQAVPAKFNLMIPQAANRSQVDFNIQNSQVNLSGSYNAQAASAHAVSAHAVSRSGSQSGPSTAVDAARNSQQASTSGNQIRFARSPVLKIRPSKIDKS